MAESKGITNLEELRKVRLADEGYIVITDTARPTLVHRVNATCIKIDSFNLKVSLGKSKQGGYFWVDSVATAGREFGAQRCKVCKPELQLVDPSNFKD